MAIDVTCPGCFKRFQVSDRYAGQKGPCPSCNAIITIPKEQVKIHAPEDFQSGGKTVKGRVILKPIDRKVAVIGAKEWTFAILCAIGAFGFAFWVGHFRETLGHWGVDAIATIGIVAIAFGVSIFGYVLLRSGDELEYHEGVELYKRAGMCAAAYSALWVIFEIIVAYVGLQGMILYWFFLVPFVAVSIIASYGLFDLDYLVAVAHYLLFFIAVLFLRWAIGFGWLWAAAEFASQASGGRIPPPLPTLK
ncbi:MAG: zinc-ribbon domain-containing protein [Planctomycetaceae bacterium]|jgi:hypothetical protein|nr:zinc-ribbon domain-containing protein [Planctomycetaceae bacterium]